MKLRHLLILTVASLVFLSCDSSLFINVRLDKELKNDQNYALIDYDFVLANTNNSDALYFEFVLNKRLEPSTIITFYDQSGNSIAAKQAGSPADLSTGSGNTDGNSFVYSIKLENLRSVSLIHNVMIGSE